MTEKNQVNMMPQTAIKNPQTQSATVLNTSKATGQEGGEGQDADIYAQL